jgi:hypothetical protein
VELSLRYCLSAWRGLATNFCVLLGACGIEERPLAAPNGGYAVEYECNDCVLRVEDPVSFTHRQLPGLTSLSEIEIDPNSEQLRFAYAPTDAPGEVRLFELGSDSARTLTRYGEGPGELGEIQALTWGGHDILVAFGATRYSTVHIASGEVVHFQFPARFSTLRVAGDGRGTLVVNNHRPVGHRFYAFRVGDTAVVGFGSSGADRESASGLDRTAFQHVAITSEGRVFTGPVSSVWSTEVWSSAGERLVTIARPAWHESLNQVEYERATSSSDTLELRKETPLTSIGLIDERFGMAMARAPVARPFRVGEPGSENFNGLLEVVELSTGALLATIRFKGLSRHLSVGGWVPIATEDSEGFIGVDFYRVRVEVNR